MRRSNEFAAAVRRGRRAGRRTLVVHLGASEASGEATDPARIGFVVSRAVGGAVVRNHVRRRLRHLVQGRLDSLGAGSLLVIRALPPAASARASELDEDLSSALATLRRKRPTASQLEDAP